MFITGWFRFFLNLKHFLWNFILAFNNLASEILSTDSSSFFAALTDGSSKFWDLFEWAGSRKAALISTFFFRSSEDVLSTSERPLPTFLICFEEIDFLQDNASILWVFFYIDKLFFLHLCSFERHFYVCFYLDLKTLQMYMLNLKIKIENIYKNNI